MICLIHLGKREKRLVGSYWACLPTSLEQIPIWSQLHWTRATDFERKGRLQAGTHAWKRGYGQLKWTIKRGVGEVSQHARGKYAWVLFLALFFQKRQKFHHFCIISRRAIWLLGCVNAYLGNETSLIRLIAQHRTNITRAVIKMAAVFNTN